MGERGVARVGCSAGATATGAAWCIRRSSPKRWFGYYTLLFATVELNSTFYRLPTPAAADSWAAQGPPDFLHTLKLGQFGSHRMIVEQGRFVRDLESAARQQKDTLEGRPSVGIAGFRRSLGECAVVDHRSIDIDADTAALLEAHRQTQREALARVDLAGAFDDRVFANDVGDPTRSAKHAIVWSTRAEYP